MKLTRFAFSKSWGAGVLHVCSTLQCEHQQDGSWKVWDTTVGVDECDKVCIIHPNKRCDCDYQSMCQIQCAHETKVNPAFELSKWHQRWWQQRACSTEFVCSISNKENKDDKAFPVDNDPPLTTMMMIPIQKTILKAHVIHKI